MNTNVAQASSAAKSSGQLNQLEQLRKFTRIVADTGDFALLKEYTPEDATTNPTLILKATQKPEYHELVMRVIGDGKKAGRTMEEIYRSLLIAFGLEILKIVPGRVSTETSPKTSFDAKALVDEAHGFIDSYAKAGIGKERVLVKLATTWEGIEAARVLQKEGINCNMTLLFSLAQAIGAADAGRGSFRRSWAVFLTGIRNRRRILRRSTTPVFCPCARFTCITKNTATKRK